MSIHCHSATYCNTLQHSATLCNTPQHATSHCTTLQHRAVHCNTCNTLQCTAPQYPWPSIAAAQPSSASGRICARTCATRYDTLQHTAMHCNTVPMIIHCRSTTEQCIGMNMCTYMCNALRYTATYCHALQHSTHDHPLPQHNRAVHRDGRTRDPARDWNTEWHCSAYPSASWS